MPSNICKICHEDLITLYKFKRKLVESETKLKENLTKELNSLTQNESCEGDSCISKLQIQSKILDKQVVQVHCTSNINKKLRKGNLLKHDQINAGLLCY